jgi:hypothetical protein
MPIDLRDRVVAATTGLFSHGPQPLEHTLDYLGDPGLLGPSSMSWEVIGDSTAFVGGIRALLMFGRCSCRPLIPKWSPGSISTRPIGSIRWVV